MKTLNTRLLWSFQSQVEGFGSVVKHLTADPGTASSTPSHQLKFHNGDMYWFFPGEMLPGTLFKEPGLSCVVGPLVHVYCTMDHKHIQYVRPEAECECPIVSLNNAPIPSIQSQYTNGCRGHSGCRTRDHWDILHTGAGPLPYGNTSTITL